MIKDFVFANEHSNVRVMMTAEKIMTFDVVDGDGDGDGDGEGEGEQCEKDDLALC